MTDLKKTATNYFNTTGTLTSTITAPYSTSVSIDKISSGALVGILKDSVEKSLKEEDEDGTLSKLITSIVIDKMYELSGMSEEELVETELYKRISDKVDQRLANIENRLSSLENAVGRLQESSSNCGYSITGTNYGYA